jgi:L-fuculose-phosphate aldolase
VYEDFCWVGRRLEERGLITAQGGNLSVRQGDSMVITRTESFLGDLKEEDLVTVPLNAEPPEGTYPSREWKVHQAIYKNSDAMAVVHAHPVFAVALSFLVNQIETVDAEGVLLLGKVPVISAESAVASAEVAYKMGEMASQTNAAMVKGHGSFVWANSLKEAYSLTTTLDASAKMLFNLTVVMTRGK